MNEQTQSAAVKALTAVTALDEARAMRARVLAEKEAVVRAVLEPVRESLDAVDAEYQTTIATADDAVAFAEKEARAAVLALGGSVKAGKTIVSYVEGGWKWDAAGLNGVLTVVPQLADLRTPTPPTTRVSEFKGKQKEGA